MGNVDIYSTTPLPLRFTWGMPTAASVPIIAANTLLDVARTRLFLAASNMDLSRKSSSYHFREKPPQMELILLLLKEYTITIIMGRYMTTSMKPK